MPKSCSARNCSNHHMMKEKKVSFFRFPNAIKRLHRRNQWISACQRLNPDGSQWLPGSKYVYICSEHFVTGRPVDEPGHMDYVPTVFSPYTQSSNSAKKKRRRKSRGTAPQLKAQEKLREYEAAEILASLATMNNNNNNNNTRGTTSEPSPSAPSVEMAESQSALNVY